MTFASRASAAQSEPGLGTPASPGDLGGWRMPDEGEPHIRTWMALGASEAIWGEDLIDEAWGNLADVAGAIAQFEEVRMLVRPDEVDWAEEALPSSVMIVPMEIDDLWVRDTGPVFVLGQQGEAGVDFNFNGWGDKQAHAADARVAAELLELVAAPPITTKLVLEGGALEVDGHGNAIITRSCVLNDNRNPGWTAEDVEAELARLLGIRNVIWLPGIAGKDITDGHTDFYARFAGPGVVVAALDDDPGSYDYEVTREHLSILKTATLADGAPLDIITLTAPRDMREEFLTDDFAAGYVNYYLCNDAVVMPQFGDKAADQAAADTLQRLFPERTVVQVAIDGIAAGGGGIHCATQQQPLLVT